MTRHLSSDEHVAAIEGRLDALRQTHLAECAACRDQVAEGQAVLAHVAAAGVPEPSPLFWDHFSARVRAATAGAIPAARQRGWGWRGWLALTSAAMAVVLTVFVVTRPPAVPAPGIVPQRAGQTSGAAPDLTGPAGEGAAEPWAAVVQMASGLSPDDVRGVAPVDGNALPTVEDLTPAERAAFVELLNSEMEKTP